MKSIETFAFVSHHEPSSIQIATINSERVVQPHFSINFSCFLDENATFTDKILNCDSINALASHITQCLRANESKTMTILKEFNNTDNQQEKIKLLETLEN